MKESYTKSEFCRAYSMSRTHLDKLIKLGKAPHVLNIGGKLIITGEAVDAWLKKLDEEQYGSQDVV